MRSLALTILLSFSYLYATSCKCIKRKGIESSEIVFVGQCLKVTKSQKKNEHGEIECDLIAHFKVDSVIKGNVGETFLMKNGDCKMKTSCDIFFEKGDISVIYCRSIEESEQVLGITNKCFHNTSLMSLTDTFEIKKDITYGF